MKLPKDVNEWTPRHLARAIAERDAAFDRYEAAIDFRNRGKSEHLFAIYMRKDTIVHNIRKALS